jgi:4-hydroxybenzoate polyprenyltransferase
MISSITRLTPRWPAPGRDRFLRGRITPFAATVFLVVQALVGLMVLVQFNEFSILLGIASLGVVAIYPFAKRFTDCRNSFSVWHFPGAR